MPQMMPRALNQRRRRSSVTMQCWRIQRTSGGHSITPSNTKTTRYSCPTGPGKDMWSCSRGRLSMMDMQLVSSRDDLHWDRTADRKLFMHLVPTNSYRGGAFDCTQNYPLRHRWRKTDGAGCSTPALPCRTTPRPPTTTGASAWPPFAWMASALSMPQVRDMSLPVPLPGTGAFSRLQPAGMSADTSSVTHLLVDDDEITRKEGVVRHTHPCRKLQQPVIPGLES